VNYADYAGKRKVKEMDELTASLVAAAASAIEGKLVDPRKYAE